MGVDLKKTRERKEAEEAKAQARAAGRARFWSPPSGDNLVRLLPPWADEEHNPDSKQKNQFYREVYVHFSVGADEDSARTFLCPMKSPDGPKTSCLVCQFIERLRKSGAPADIELAEDMRAKQRFYTNVIVLADPVYAKKDVDEYMARQEDKTRECPFKLGDSKIQVMSYGPMLWNDLMAIFCNSGEDITDPSNGHNVIVTKSGQGKNGTRYRAQAEFKATPLQIVSDKDVYDIMPNLDAVMAFVDPDEMIEALSTIDPTMSVGVGAPKETPPGLPAQQRAAAPAAQVAPKAAPKALPAKPEPAKPVTNGGLKVFGDEDAPPCYQDKETCALDDAECVGGTKVEDGEKQQYEPCPGLTTCHTAKFGVPPPSAEKPKGRRRAAPATDAAALEDDLRNALK